MDYLLQALENIGIDMLHVSSGIPENRKLQLPTTFEYNDTVHNGCHVKKHINIPVIAVNDIRTLSRGKVLLENDRCDFVAYGKPFLADSTFIEHSMKNNDHKPCYECQECKWATNSEKCPAQVISNSHS